MHWVESTLRLLMTQYKNGPIMFVLKEPLLGYEPESQLWSCKQETEFGKSDVKITSAHCCKKKWKKKKKKKKTPLATQGFRLNSF